MKYTYLTSIFFFVIITLSCGSLNRAHGELHYNNNITKGQELIDLKKALTKNAISEQEYNMMKKKVINDEYTKEIINSSKGSLKTKIEI